MYIKRRRERQRGGRGGRRMKANGVTFSQSLKGRYHLPRDFFRRYIFSVLLRLNPVSEGSFGATIVTASRLATHAPLVTPLLLPVSCVSMRACCSGGGFPPSGGSSRRHSNPQAVTHHQKRSTPSSRPNYRNHHHLNTHTTTIPPPPTPQSTPAHTITISTITIPSPSPLSQLGHVTTPRLRAILLSSSA